MAVLYALVYISYFYTTLAIASRTWHFFKTPINKCIYEPAC